MADIRTVGVIDIGKTNAKVALVDLDSLKETDLHQTPNVPLADGRYPHHDVVRIWEFILESLTSLNKVGSIDAVSVTTHGATAALLDAGGKLAIPVLDYEHGGPDSMRDAYEAVRPPFEETGSPPLPGGLNLGAQLFWQCRAFPDAFARIASVLMYPQYWAFRLTGVAANEVTSLGCHTDLWSPARRDLSSLIERSGWRTLFPPVRPARDRLGPILPEIARRTGLSAGTPVFCGIHDSNASLLPHLLSRAAPFAVVSTGTWVVSMAVGGSGGNLDPARDTLINVSALGDPVPSARFMGGREYAALTGGINEGWSEDDLEAVLADRLLLLPSVQLGSGPFPAHRSRWCGPREPESGERAVAASFYLALTTAICLDLIGAAGDIVVEGPFAGNEPFARMLSAATGRTVITSSGGATGASVGAAFVVFSTTTSSPTANEKARRTTDERWRAYAAEWRAAVGESSDEAVHSPR